MPPTATEEQTSNYVAKCQTRTFKYVNPGSRSAHQQMKGQVGQRVLGHYVRDAKLFTLEEGVRRMTSLPAAQFGLKDRGMLRPGAYADLVLFDPDTIADRATFEQPKTPAAGIVRVMVNGRTVWREGAATGERPGRALRRSSLGPMGAMMATH